MRRDKAPGGKHHKNGKRTGYDLENGRYFPAPSHTERFNDLLAEEQGLREYVATLNHFLEERFRAVAQAKKRWWDNLCDDLGMDRNKSWEYDRNNESVHEYAAPTPANPKE